MDKEQRFADTMALLRERFLIRTQDQYMRIQDLYNTVLAGNGSASVAEELIHICHSLHGAAGVFGFAEVGEAAGRVEWRLRLQLRELGQLHTDTPLDAAVEQLLVLLTVDPLASIPAREKRRESPPSTH